MKGTLDIEGPVSADIVMASPVTREAMDGGLFLIDLKKKGRLPGFAKNDPGTATFYAARDASVEDIKEVTYPFSRTYQFVKNGSSYKNDYTIVRARKDSRWRMEKA